MQQTPPQRTIRFIFFSIGLLLFIFMVTRAAQHVSDPKEIAGSPYILGVADVSQPISAKSISYSAEGTIGAIELAHTVTTQAIDGGKQGFQNANQPAAKNTAHQESNDAEVSAKTKQDVHVINGKLHAKL